MIEKIKSYASLILGMAGYVPAHATTAKTFLMASSLAAYAYVAIYHPTNSPLAIVYYSIAEVLYLGFLGMVLRENGYRKWFIEKFGEERGYRVYEHILGFLFFHNAASIGYVASSFAGNLFDFVYKEILVIVAAILFVSGFAVKLWATKTVSIDIYYWKDMFLGKTISPFAVTGPYKYFKNPMYGIGQLPAYAVALWYGSIYGLLAAMLNQALIFSFYYLEEKKFIERQHA